MKRMRLLRPLCGLAMTMFVICGLWTVDCGLIFAQENAQERAEEIHKIASSDVIYGDEELKALYYQNVQMIELLREIRDLLERQVVDKGEE